MRRAFSPVRIGVERGVIIQGNPHGTDNSALLDALAREPRRLRAVAIANDAVSGTALKRMADAGVCALRARRWPSARSLQHMDAGRGVAQENPR